MISCSLLITMYIGLQLLTIPEEKIPGWLNIFKEYPVLNQGTYEGVKENFKKYSQEPHCIFLIAKTDDHQVAAIATGIPLTAAYPGDAELFKKNNIDPSRYFHINDLTVLPQYRNQGFGLKLYKKLKKKARLWGYKGMCLCTIEREENHPLKPLHYKDPETFWKHLGFSKTSLIVKEAWPTIMDAQGTVAMYESKLFLWTQELE